MSSHHIVKENQEPALLITDFRSIDLESLGQLLEWSPTILTDVNNFDFLLAEGIKVDVVFADQQLPAQDSVLYLSCKNDLFQDAFEYLYKNNFRAVNIVTDRIPDGLRQFAGHIDMVFFSQEKRFALYDQRFEKWKPAGERIYVSETKIKTLHGADYISPGQFVTSKDGFVRLEFNTKEFVLVGEDF